MGAENPTSGDSTPKPTTTTNTPQPSPTPPVSVDDYAGLTKHAHDQIDWVRKYYGWLAVGLGVILGLSGYVTYNSVKDMRADMRQSVQEMSTRVDRRIDVEFSKESIQQLVQRKAEERVDLMADRIISERIDQIVRPAFTEFESKLKRLDGRANEIEQTTLAKVSDMEAKLKTLESNALAELRQTSEFILVVTEAQANDRRAFDRLTGWAEDRTSPFSDRAREARDRIVDDPAWATEFSSTDNWGKSDPRKWPLDKYRAMYPSASLTDRGYLLSLVVDRKDIPKKVKMEFFVNVMKTDRDLRMVASAAHNFLDESKQPGVRMLDIDKMTSWWEEHKAEYEKDAQPAAADANKVK